jgi:dipeptidyl aminopeptidase/acylaminoacyl peptidase
MLNNSKITIIILFLSIISVIPVSAQNEPITMADQVKLESPYSPVISPNGDKVLFTIRKPDFIQNRWVTQIYLLNVPSDSYYQFTTNGKSCTNPKFSPDGKLVTFLSGRNYLNKESEKMESDGRQIWAAPLSGGEALNLTSIKGGVDEYCWSHRGNLIAFLSEKENDTEGPQKVFPKENPIKVLNLFDVNSGKIISSFELDAGAADISFSSNDNKIIYQTNYTAEYNDDQKYDIFSIDLNGNKTRLTSEAGPETAPAYSPDDKTIAYITQTVPDIEFAETDLNIMNADGTGKKNLTKDFNLSVDNLTWKDNNNIYFTVNEGTNEHLYRITLNDNKIEKLTSGNMEIANVSFSKKGDLCYASASAKTLNEIFINNKPVTNFGKQLIKYNPTSQEVVSYKSRDGKFNIEGILFKPDNFNPAKKYPLILTVHGGPYGSFKNTFLQTYGTRVWTDNGYLVFAPNPRGSNGYSDAFSQANRYDLGGGDYRDIMDGVDYIISKGIVDTTRMGVTGGSYGGYLTNWIISQNNRFKAAVSMYGLFSLFTDWSNSWQPSWEKMYLGYYYWEKPIDMNNQYVSRSPAFYAQNITTPTLILHGDKDVYTNLSNSREMYQALHTRNVPVKFVVYPGEGHGLRRKPNDYINVVERATKWFKKFILSK